MSVVVPEPLPAVQVDTLDTDPPRRPGRGRRLRETGTAGIGSRPGFLTYGLLAAFIIGSVYPLWWSVVMGSSDKSALTDTWPSLLPGGRVWINAMLPGRTRPGASMTRARKRQPVRFL